MQHAQNSHAESVLATARNLVRESMLVRQDSARRMGGYRTERAVMAEAAAAWRGLTQHATRRRLAADLAHHALDERAFDMAVGAFDETLRTAFHPGLGADDVEVGQARHDAELEALQAFLARYLAEAGR